MAGVVKCRLHAIAKSNRLFVLCGLEVRNGSLSILRRVKRDLGIWPFSALSLMSSALVFRVLLLQMGRVQEDDLGIWIEVTARAVGADSGYGVTTSSHTYAIDNLAPIITPVSPDSAQIFNRDQSGNPSKFIDDYGGMIAPGL